MSLVAPFKFFDAVTDVLERHHDRRKDLSGGAPTRSGASHYSATTWVAIGG